MSERRVGWILFAVLASLLLVLSFEAPSGGLGDNWIEGTMLRVVAPVAHSVAALSGSARGAAESIATHDDLVKENRALRRHVERLELELLRMSHLEGELERLGTALDYSRAASGRLQVADIVYADHSSWLRSLILYTGDQEVIVNQPVVSDRGLVGRVIEVVPGYAKVQLVTDRSAGVGAMIQRTRRQGLMRSGPDGLGLDFVPQQADVRPGDLVVTSGIDGIYPRGLPLGQVATVDKGEGSLFLGIGLEPAVDFGFLDQVYLLSRRPVPNL